MARKARTWKIWAGFYNDKFTWGLFATKALAKMAYDDFRRVEVREIVPRKKASGKEKKP